MGTGRLRRGVVLGVAGALASAAVAGCARREEAEVSAATLARRPDGYGWLTPLRLNVRDVEVEPAPPGAASRADPPAPLVPATEVARMGRDRVVPAGSATAALARFAVVTATLTRERVPGGGLFGPEPSERLACALRCRVEVLGEGGARVAFAEAEARRTATSADNAGVAGRARAAEALVARAMDDLNVEFEVQVRANLRDWLVGASEPGTGAMGVGAAPRPPTPGPPGGAPFGTAPGVGGGDGVVREDLSRP